MTNALSLENLVKKYGDQRVVDDLPLKIREGEIFGLVGPNGSGKTITMRTALDIIRPDSGSVALFGKPAIERCPWACRIPAGGARPGSAVEGDSDTNLPRKVEEDGLFRRCRAGRRVAYQKLVSMSTGTRRSAHDPRRRVQRAAAGVVAKELVSDPPD